MIRSIYIFVTSFSAITFLPLLTFASGHVGGNSNQPYFGKVDSFFTNIVGFIDGVLIPFVFALALLIFIWGMFRFFILGGDNEDERAKGKQLILWSIIGMVIMVSIWGIVNVVAEGLFGTVTGGQVPTLPKTPTL